MRMILPDVNVVVHAHRADLAVHSAARRWWDECLATARVSAWPSGAAWLRAHHHRPQDRGAPARPGRCHGSRRKHHAHLAVLAMERGYVLYSTDADFGRFPGRRWVNPCPG
jgi:uncharacterized protein